MKNTKSQLISKLSDVEKELAKVSTPRLLAARNEINKILKSGDSPVLTPEERSRVLKMVDDNVEALSKLHQLEIQQNDLTITIRDFREYDPFIPYRAAKRHRMEAK